jgi:hypothetical protein
MEESVVRRIRETQGGVAEATEWEQMERRIQLETIQTIVERVGYDGTSRQISIRFHSTAAPTTREETRA